MSWQGAPVGWVTGGSQGTKAGPWPVKGPRNSTRGDSGRGAEQPLLPEPEAAPAGGGAHRGHGGIVGIVSPGQAGSAHSPWDSEGAPSGLGLSPPQPRMARRAGRPGPAGSTRGGHRPLPHGARPGLSELSTRVCERARVKVSVPVSAGESVCESAHVRVGVCACPCVLVCVRVSACACVRVNACISVRTCTSLCVSVCAHVLVRELVPETGHSTRTRGQERGDLS